MKRVFMAPVDKQFRDYNIYVAAKLRKIASE